MWFCYYDGINVTVGVYVIAPLFQTSPWKEYCDFVTMMGLDVTVGVYVIAPLFQTPPWKEYCDFVTMMGLDAWAYT